MTAPGRFRAARMVRRFKPGPRQVGVDPRVYKPETVDWAATKVPPMKRRMVTRRRAKMIRASRKANR